MFPCVSAIGRALLITSVGDLSNGSYLRLPRDLFLGVVFHLNGFFTHIHLLGQTHLLKYSLLGPWFSARAQVHPLKIAFHNLYLINAEVEIVAKGM